MDITRKNFLRFIPAVILGSAFILSNQAFAEPNGGYNSGYAGGQNGWSFKVGLPYQKFSNNGTEYASSYDREYNIDTDYHLGYNLGIGYYLASKGSTINLDYTRLHATDSDSVYLDDLTIFQNPVTNATGKIKYSYDSVDLTAGHSVSISPTFDLYYYGGLNYTHLAKDMIISGNDVDDFYTRKSGTDFKGIGPEFGVDGTCRPIPSTPGFGVVGGLKTVFPYGNMSGYLRDYENDDVFNEHIPDTKIVAPGIGAKLALQYDFPTAGMNWSTQLGYQSTTYFGVTKDSSYSGTVINTNFQGLYFNLAGKF
ncbi:hypothetical protein AQUSIP_17390 [Aquicella siphonis]|uniref:Outer membrane protein beta-barrel domain-containing protein n=1 Tax=Aquicella siphonis TaxID=254247 RepID=A0A5E4PJF1_9COXI|nr:Lpg1974 family pore-forming outer membrane protein [Aquicella siphonis]VVC76426.1 hypothetical protein AQUSIP_17390 [Aquicella siphonis]